MASRRADNLTYMYIRVHIGCTLYVGSNKQRVHTQLCELVSDTSLGEILASVSDGGHCEELYRRYLHDFVYTVHKCPHKQKEIVSSEYQVRTSR